MDEAEIFDAADETGRAIDLPPKTAESFAKLVTKFLIDVERIADALECMACCAVEDRTPEGDHDLHNGETEGNC